MKTFELTERAKQKGIVELKMSHYNNLGDFATGIVHEKRIVHLDQKEAKRTKQKTRLDDVIYPVMIFPTELKHADYDRAKRFLEKAGLVLPLPNPDEFRTELYSVDLGPHQNILRGWGYDSGLLPPTKRWQEDRIASNTSLWVDDNEILAEMVSFTVQNMYAEFLEDGSFVLEDEAVLFEKIKTKFSYAGLF